MANIKDALKNLTRTFKVASKIQEPEGVKRTKRIIAEAQRVSQEVKERKE